MGPKEVTIRSVSSYYYLEIVQSILVLKLVERDLGWSLLTGGRWFYNLAQLIIQIIF